MTISHQGYIIKVFIEDNFSVYTFLHKTSATLTALLSNLGNDLEKLDGVSEVVLGLDSITLFHNSFVKNTIKKKIVESEFNTNLFNTNTIFIETKYNGVDLQNVCDSLLITPKELIEQHTKNEYYVAMIGFLPGFVYIGGLDESLIIQRKTSPSKKVNPGSVAIANGFSGIYPIASPGGWHIIGQTEFKNFDIKASPFFRLRVGDKIKFVDV